MDRVPVPQRVERNENRTRRGHGAENLSILPKTPRVMLQPWSCPISLIPYFICSLKFTKTRWNDRYN